MEKLNYQNEMKISMSILCVEKKHLSQLERHLQLSPYSRSSTKKRFQRTTSGNSINLQVDILGERKGSMETKHWRKIPASALMGIPMRLSLVLSLCQGRAPPLPRQLFLHPPFHALWPPRELVSRDLSLSATRSLQQRCFTKYQ